MDKDILTTVSIEKMAAYLDGNLPEDEMAKIGNIMLNDESLRDLIEESDTIDGLQITYPISDIDLQAFNVPQIEDINTNIHQDMEKITIGITGPDVKDPIFIEQPDDHSCALRCQQIIMRDYGIDIPFKDLERLAIDNNIYSSNGTLICDMGKAMDLAGVPYHITQGGTVKDLMSELIQGHRVMVALDANELWYNSTKSEHLKNEIDDFKTEFFKRVFNVNGGNHALIVAGFEVNPNNPKDLKVVLTDPGDGHYRITYPADQFVDAWHDSNCLMVATDNPAPYQYDFEHSRMIPSQFAIQEHLNDWVTEHSYQLNPDMIDTPANYVPYYSNGSHYSALHELLDATNYTAQVSSPLEEAVSAHGGNHSIDLDEIDIDNIQAASLSQIYGGDWMSTTPSSGTDDCPETPDED